MGLTVEPAVSLQSPSLPSRFFATDTNASNQEKQKLGVKLNYNMYLLTTEAYVLGASSTGSSRVGDEGGWGGAIGESLFMSVELRNEGICSSG